MSLESGKIWTFEQRTIEFRNVYDKKIGCDDKKIACDVWTMLQFQR